MGGGDKEDNFAGVRARGSKKGGARKGGGEGEVRGQDPPPPPYIEGQRGFKRVWGFLDIFVSIFFKKNFCTNNSMKMRNSCFYNSVNLQCNVPAASN